MIIDISHHHPIKNWNEAKSCEFLISKATEGTSYVDQTLESFVNGCENNGIPFWLYTFITKEKEVDSVKFMIEKCEPLLKKSKYFVGYIIDCEKNPRTQVYPSVPRTRDALKYLEEYCKEKGYKSMFYSGYADYSKYLSVIESIGKDTAFWEARYGLNDGVYRAAYRCHELADLHQYTSRGSVSFANGDIDMNIVTGRKPIEWFRSCIGYPAKQIAKPTLKSGSRGENARLLQKNLNEFGYKLAEDGIVGKNTISALKKWQKTYGLSVDGIYGPKSAAKMNALL